MYSKTLTKFICSKYIHLKFIVFHSGNHTDDSSILHYADFQSNQMLSRKWMPLLQHHLPQTISINYQMQQEIHQHRRENSACHPISLCCRSIWPILIFELTEILVNLMIFLLKFCDFSKFRDIYPKKLNCVKGAHFYQSIHVQFAGNWTYDLGIAITIVYCLRFRNEQIRTFPHFLLLCKFYYNLLC